MSADTTTPVLVLLAGPSLDCGGGVANYLRLLLRHNDSSQVIFRYVPVGKSSADSPASRRPLDYVVSVWRFCRTLRRSRPEVVHLSPSLTWRSLPLNLLLLILAKLLSKAPVVVFFRGWRDDIASAMILNRPAARFLKKLLCYADRYLVLDETFRDALIEAGFSSDRIIVSPVMVDTQLFGAPQPKEPAEPGSGVFHVLFLSRLVRSKGVWELCDAIRCWQDRYAEVPIVVTIAGDGPEFDALQAALTLDIERGYVRMPGYVSGADKMSLFHQADAFVFPSCHNEGFPNAIVEALAAGLPLIYTPVGALAEVLGPENGIRIELDSLSGPTLGHALRRLYVSPSLREAMGEANRHLAQRYDVAQVCAHMADVYQSIAHGSTRASVE